MNGRAIINVIATERYAYSYCFYNLTSKEVRGLISWESEQHRNDVCRGTYRNCWLVHCVHAKTV